MFSAIELSTIRQALEEYILILESNLKDTDAAEDAEKELTVVDGILSKLGGSVREKFQAQQ